MIKRLEGRLRKAEERVPVLTTSRPFEIVTIHADTIADFRAQQAKWVAEHPGTDVSLWIRVVSTPKEVRS